MEELLPVGSKVELHSKRKFVIIGYLPSKPNDERQYDYICCRDRYGINWKKDKLKKARKAKDTLTEEEVKEIYVDALRDFIGEIGELKNEG